MTFDLKYARSLNHPSMHLNEPQVAFHFATGYRKGLKSLYPTIFRPGMTLTFNLSAFIFAEIHDTPSMHHHDTKLAF